MFRADASSSAAPSQARSCCLRAWRWRGRNRRPASATGPANDYAGACGDSSGGYVLAIQEAAYSRGSYGGPLDSRSGAHTLAGIRGLQAYFGLAQDGCAGPATWGGVRSRLQYIGPPPGYVADQPTYGINFGARAQYYDYNGCWANYAYGGTATPVAANRYYLNKQALDGRTPQPPITHGGTVPYCGTI